VSNQLDPYPCTEEDELSTTTRLSGSIAALSIAATLAITATADAKAGERTYQQTYPVASQLCANVAAGKGPKRLRPYAAQVLADCATLSAGFSSAQSAVLAAQASFASGLAADKAAIAAVCTPPVKNHPLCRSTRRNENAAIRALRREHTAAVHLYYTTVEANRRTFWAAIHSLPGGKGIPADKPIPQQSS
jgi:hypothetical protein